MQNWGDSGPGQTDWGATDTGDWSTEVAAAVPGGTEWAAATTENWG